ncbi:MULTISPECIES: hypothetical protein [unclassified Sulfitobacter]|uniref:hypothetical protein n=2 Tax=Roseobacteraceae TaxID=2854170 RepID=UPI0007C32F6A|nr:hypothetical protein [Sulfitobacter sp. HI0054]KZY53681.1 hypothetical protein A3734_14595 [Sulfitobacter sp. HI0054]MDH4539758.1 hypothetical protein [Sulfitobacter faviae]TKA84569.1 hypothetical protein FCK22_15045 [Sulfitobacter sp. 15WGC]
MPQSAFSIVATAKTREGEMSQQHRKDSATPAKPVDWIVVGANALGLVVVALAAFHAQTGGLFQEVASQAAQGTVF